MYFSIFADMYWAGHFWRNKEKRVQKVVKRPKEKKTAQKPITHVSMWPTCKQALTTVKGDVTNVTLHEDQVTIVTCVWRTSQLSPHFLSSNGQQLIQRWIQRAPQFTHPLSQKQRTWLLFLLLFLKEERGTVATFSRPTNQASIINRTWDHSRKGSAFWREKFRYYFQHYYFQHYFFSALFLFPVISSQHYSFQFYFLLYD